MNAMLGTALVCVWCILAGAVQSVLTATRNAETPSPPVAGIVDVIVPDVLEPLPEYIAVRPETKVLSRYWAELESRRMSTLKMCELKLWGMTRQGPEGAPAAPEIIKEQNVVKKSLSSVPEEVFVPVYEGRAVVRDIETSLRKCHAEVRKLENRDNGKAESTDVLLIAIGREIDQIEACLEAGGTVNLHKTAAAVAHVKTQIARLTDQVEAMGLLKNTLNSLKLDTETCLASLGLPQEATEQLSYPTIP